MPFIIAEDQQAFIQGRNIADCSMIANEFIHLLAARRVRAFLFKTDFRKAFNSISWDYLETVMSQMEFNSTWIAWIHVCLATAHMSVLINGSPSDSFAMQRGGR